MAAKERWRKKKREQRTEKEGGEEKNERFNGKCVLIRLFFRTRFTYIETIEHCVQVLLWRMQKQFKR